MKTIAEQLTQLAQIKSDIRQAIISKGVQVAETDGLAVYASKIAAINAIIPTISFTIGGTTYQAEEGMTWTDWMRSSYAPSEISFGISQIRYNNNPVSPNDLIIDGGAYSISGSSQDL